MRIKSGIYKIRNTFNNHCYIGAAVNFGRRKKEHFGLLRKNKHHCRHLQNAFNLYGRDKFVFEIVEPIENISSILERENWWIANTTDTYNIIQEGILNHLGIKRSEETKRKISAALTGKHLSEETKRKLREANLGKKQTKSTIEKKRKKNFKAIIQLDEFGKTVKEWKSATEAELRGGFNRKCIYRCVWGHRPTYKKFMWLRKST